MVKSHVSQKLDGTSDNDPMTPLMTISQDCREPAEKHACRGSWGWAGGTMAALRLSQHGVKVTLYEAHPQGGRSGSQQCAVCQRAHYRRGRGIHRLVYTAWLQLAERYGIAMINRMGDLEYGARTLEFETTAG